MYARVTLVSLKVDSADEATRIFQEDVLPILRKQQGFRGATLLADPLSGKGMSLSFWEHEADLEATEANGLYQDQLAKFQPLFSAPPEREMYQVRVQE